MLLWITDICEAFLFPRIDVVDPQRVITDDPIPTMWGKSVMEISGKTTVPWDIFPLLMEISGKTTVPWDIFPLLREC